MLCILILFPLHNTYIASMLSVCMFISIHSICCTYVLKPMPYRNTQYVNGTVYTLLSVFWCGTHNKTHSFFKKRRI